jgi:hypothetical protein
MMAPASVLCFTMVIAKKTWSGLIIFKHLFVARAFLRASDRLRCDGKIETLLSLSGRLRLLQAPAKAAPRRLSSTEQLRRTLWRKTKALVRTRFGGSFAPIFLQARAFVIQAFATICHLPQTARHGAPRSRMTMPKLLILAGLVLIAAGLLWMVGERFGFGRLPGDIVIERGNFRVYFPLATSLLLSVALSLLFWLFNR